MTLNKLKSEYARVRDEIDALGSARNSKTRLARLRYQLDQIELALLSFRRLAVSAPTLSDVVPWAEPARRRIGEERRARAR